MEHLRKRVKVRLVNNAKDYNKYVSKLSLVSQKIFNKSFVAIHEMKPVLRLDKPIYVAFSILDLSNLLIYEFHYNYIKIKYTENLLFYRHSLVYEIETNNVYEDFYEDKSLFGFSDYPENSKVFNPVNKNVIGKMKMKSKGK